MAEIMVTSQQLITTADNLQQLNESLKSQIQILESTEGALAGMWEGATKEAFHSAFMKDKGQMETFKSTIDQYVSALRDIAAKYEQAEAANVNIASTRNY